MIGEDSILKNTPCSISVKCTSPEGQLWIIKRQDFIDLQNQHHEAFKQVRKSSRIINKRLYNVYLTKLRNIEQIKQNSHQIDNDTKNFCKNLMNEMLWNKPPTTIEKFTIKKQLKFHPEM